MSHTTGPWEPLKGAEGEPERWAVVHADPPHWLIATIENGQPGDTLETEAATAILVARAPRLLASLKALVADIQEEMWSVSKCWCHQITSSERTCDVCDLAAAKALIAEIEGGA